MRTKKIKLLTTLLFIVICQCQAQNLKFLKIGDTVPSIYLKDILFYPKSNGDIKDFVGKKAVIIDFFATYCAPCMAAIPHLDTLQKRYSNELSIVVATAQDRNTIENLFKEDRFKDHKMPFIVQSKENLQKHFAFNSLPHQIWIDRQGIVKARVSGNSYLTDENILKLIAGENLDFFEASSTLTENALPTIPLLRNNYDPNIMLSSAYVSKYDRTIKTGSIQMSNKNATKLFRIKLQNITFVDHFWIAHFGSMGGLTDSIQYNRSITVIREDSKPFQSKPDVVNKTNTFCFDGYAINRQAAHALMESALEEAFQIDSKVETRVVNCLVLKEIGTEKLYQKKSDSRPAMFKKNGYWVLDNSSIHNLLAYLNVESDRFLVINQLKYKGRLNIRFRWLPNDISEMNKDLLVYGLSFVEEKKLKPVLVLSDKQNK